VSLPVLAGIALVGGLGAVARLLLDGAVSAHAGRGFPWGTLAVNLSGAFALGAVTGAALGDDATRLLGTGFLGAYTTFSTWMLETHRQAEDGRFSGAALNVGGSLAAGLLAAWAGRRLGLAL
jgi:fluoride exporter